MKFKSRLLVTAATALCFLSIGLQAVKVEELPNEDNSSPGISRLQLNIPYETLEKAVEIYHPDVFTGAEVFDPKIVSNYRTGRVAFSSRDPEAFEGFPNSSLLPLAQKLKTHLMAYGKTHPSHKLTQQFLREIKFHQGNEDINPAWLLGMHLRFAAATSKVTKDEKQLFSHVINPHLFFGLLEKDAYKNHTSSLMMVDEYDSKGLEIPEFYYGTYLSTNAEDKLERVLKQALPFKFLYPFVGMGKFGVPFLVKANLNDVFPIGLPDEELTGHGTDLSRLGFAVHDLLHSEVDRRQEEFIAHVIQRADSYVEKGGSVEDFMQVYPVSALKKYGALMGSLNEIYGQMLVRLLPSHGIDEFLKVMVGFFWTTHEVPNFLSTIYDMNDFDKILETITTQSAISSVNGAVDEVDSWESCFDPLETSPIDGSTSWDNEKIYNWVLENMTQEESQRYKYESIELGSIDSSQIVKKKITRTNRFIDVLFTLKNGEELKYSFPTLFHKWKNADDNIGLLKLAGTLVHKPDLGSVDDPREAAQDMLDDISQEIDKHVNHFLTVAKFFANFDPQGNGNTLSNRYFKWHFGQEQKVKTLLENKLNTDIPVM